MTAALAQQDDSCRAFYEQGWAARAALIGSMIEEGETHPYRLLKRFEAYERKFEIWHDDDGARYRRAHEEHANGPGGLPPFRITSFRGQEITVPFYATDNLHNFIIDYLGEKSRYDCIVELGCGFGRNLFEIFYCGGPTNIPYFGGEITESGVALGREIAALEPAFRVDFFPFDHTKPNLAAVPKVDRAFVFTMHSIEQVRTIDPELFHVIAGIARHVTCIHFEPFGFQVADLGRATKMHANLARIRGWNQNFIAALRAAEERSWLKIEVVVTEMYLPTDAYNPTSLAIWTSTAQPGP